MTTVKDILKRIDEARCSIKKLNNILTYMVIDNQQLEDLEKTIKEAIDAIELGIEKLHKFHTEDGQTITDIIKEITELDESLELYANSKDIPFTNKDIIANLVYHYKSYILEKEVTL